MRAGSQLQVTGVRVTICIAGVQLEDSALDEDIHGKSGDLAWNFAPR